MKVKPLGDRIVVKRKSAEAKTKGGIVLPDSAQNKPQMGTVVAVGPGPVSKDGKRGGMQLKEGDTVIFTTWAGDEFSSRSEDSILIMREGDVLAVLD